MSRLALSDDAVENLADAIWNRLVGAHCDPIELNMRAKLALETRLSGGTPPFGVDKLSTGETAAYVGLQVETLREPRKRQNLKFPAPYRYGRKMFWRRSELDAWIERQREAA
jgi:predicted DNA-binding transcriptional regulator AlpA